MNNRTNLFAKQAAALFATAAVLTSNPALAEAIACTSKVLGVGILTNGGVKVNLGVINGVGGMGQPVLCSLATPTTVRNNPAAATYVISTEVCQAMLSQFLTAKTSGQDITLHFDYGMGVTAPPCTNIPLFTWRYPENYPWLINFADVLNY